MCGFVISNIKYDSLDERLKPIRSRGPDHTNSHSENGIVFTHYLLSLVQPMTPQPLATGTVTVMFNGEIYNFKELGDFLSEVQCIAEGYQRDGENFFQQLDGEYVIVIFDWANSAIVIAMDTFGTKPISMGIDADKNFVIGSLPCALQIVKNHVEFQFPPNSITRISLNDLKINSVKKNKLFSLDQYKTHYDDWCIKFEKAVLKRTRVETLFQKKFFIGLSTGHDSGAIAAALVGQKQDFIAFSVYDKSLASDYAARTVAIADFADHFLLRDLRWKSVRRDEVDLYTYQIYSLFGDYFESNDSESDSGGRGLHLVCKKAVELGLRVYLSGSGADELISDYGFAGTRVYPHSNFGGLFPNLLTEIYPWPSFYGSSMRSYLMKEEYIAGSYGIEGRYPFLDVDLVQEFLNLSPALKNSQYKAPISYYLQSKAFPFNPSVKLGF